MHICILFSINNKHGLSGKLKADEMLMSLLQGCGQFAWCLHAAVPSVYASCDY